LCNSGGVDLSYMYLDFILLCIEYVYDNEMLVCNHNAVSQFL